MASDSSDGSSSGVGSRKEQPAADLNSLQLIGRWVRQSLNNSSEGSLKEALTEVLEEHAGGDAPISPEERTLLRNMVTFGELKVGDVMVPRTDIYAVPDSITQEEMKRFFAEHRHTRIPVYGESLDHVQGFVHIKDYFRCLTGEREFNVADLKRDILFVPPSMKIVDLLLKMRLSSCHMAIVVDEYGGTDGLVTMEDLFEEIVGEIQDEHDDDEVLPELTIISDRVMEADARLKIEDLEEALHIELSDDENSEDYDTLGGLIFSHLGRIPAKGEVIQYHHGIKFEILSADPRRIKKIRLVCTDPVMQSENA